MKRFKKLLLIVRDALLDFLSTPWFFYDPKYKIRGLKWTIHKKDVNPWPSIPHMHSKEKSFVLDI